jgi:pimeloyl-ACP methyl ester carboxylesterase
VPRFVLHFVWCSNSFPSWFILYRRNLAEDKYFGFINEKTRLKSQCQPKTRSPEKNITYVNEAVKVVFGDAVPILVGASIGGNMALRYAAKFPVKGLLLVGPARVLEPDLVEIYGKFKFSTTIIWGSQDTIIASEDMRTLAVKLPKAKLVVYDGAGHSAYKDQPDRFKHDLLELYANAE